VAARVTKEAFRALQDSATITQDEKCLTEIREADLEELCRKTIRKN